MPRKERKDRDLYLVHLICPTGMKKHILYSVWRSMHKRCCNPTVRSYGSYGAKGVRVCERWNDLGNFVKDMGPRPSDKHQLDRLGDGMLYSPETTQWLLEGPNKEKRCDNDFREYKGQTKTVSVWAREYGMSPDTLSRRLKYSGMSMEEALHRPVRPCKKSGRLYPHNGKSQTIPKWSEETGIPITTLRFRFSHGWSVSDALDTPPGERRKSKKDGNEPKNEAA